jgi:hypothetical protein
MDVTDERGAQPIGMTREEQEVAIESLRRQSNLLTRIVRAESNLCGLDEPAAERLAERINHWWLHGQPMPVHEGSEDDLERIVDAVIPRWQEPPSDWRGFDGIGPLIEAWGGEDDRANELPVLIFAANHQLARMAAERLGLSKWLYVPDARHLRGRDGGQYYTDSSFWKRLDAAEMYEVLRSRRMTPLEDQQ